MAGKKKDTSLLHHLIGSRSLVWNLAKNDIKKKFAGSYFGVVWAFVQPVITVLLYWFVFEKGLNSKATDLRTGIEIPFVLWLTAGLVPWFYFQEALNGGTGVLSGKKSRVPDRYAPSGKNDIGAVYASVFCGVYDCAFHLYGIYAGLVCTSGRILFFLYDSVCDRACVCDECGDGIFPRHERSGGNPVADRHVGDADYVEL